MSQLLKSVFKNRNKEMFMTIHDETFNKEIHIALNKQQYESLQSFLKKIKGLEKKAINAGMKKAPVVDMPGFDETGLSFIVDQKEIPDTKDVLLTAPPQKAEINHLP